MLENYLTRKTIAPISRGVLLGKLITYYTRSCVQYLKYVIAYISFPLSRIHFDLKEIKDQLILIDTYFLVYKTGKEGTTNDLYFPDLEREILKSGKIFAYLPMFLPSTKPFYTYKALKRLKKRNIPLLIEFQLLNAGDLVSIFFFMCLYPLHVLKFARNLGTETYENRLLRYELLTTLNQPTFMGYSRFLQGRKIGSISSVKIRFISWFENQVIHKNIYKGLRTENMNVSILGCQLFLYPTSILNILPDQREIPLGIVPDKIVVNGPFYLPTGNVLPCEVGPSIRYKKLFEEKIQFEFRENILILLPYHDYEIVNILKILNEIGYLDEKMLIKFHPTTEIILYKNLVPSAAELVDDDIYELFRTTKIVLGAESGSLIEAASLAIPGIVIHHPDRFTHNPFPRKGRGLIWESGKNVDDIVRLINKFNTILVEKTDALLSVSKIYKEMFFSEVNEKSIRNAFDLH
jgi:hypothetical protein